MSPEDPRHGSHPGYVAHHVENALPTCDPCKAAHARYYNEIKLRRMRGEQVKVSSVGARRRLQALATLGWSRVVLAEQIGLGGTGWYSRIFMHDTIYASTHETIAELYDRLCMTFAPAGHSAALARASARRKGWAPPMAWDDIDLDSSPSGVRRAA